VAGGDEDEVDGVARGAGEEVAAEMAVRLHVADHRLDAGAPSELTADGGRDAAPLAGEEDAALVGFARPAVFGVVAAVAATVRGALDGDAGDALGLGDLRGQRVAVEGIARQAARAARIPADQEMIAIANTGTVAEGAASLTTAMLDLRAMLRVTRRPQPAAARAA
jgi:hypothetical protein